MSLLCSVVPFGYIGKLRAKQLVLWHHYWCFALSTRSLVLVWCANISSTTVRDNSRLMHYSDEALKLPVKANWIGLVDSCGAQNSTKRTTIWFLPSLTWSKTIVAIINHWAYQRWSSLQPPWLSQAAQHTAQPLISCSQNETRVGEVRDILVLHQPLWGAAVADWLPVESSCVSFLLQYSACCRGQFHTSTAPAASHHPSPSLAPDLCFRHASVFPSV